MKVVEGGTVDYRENVVYPLLSCKTRGGGRSRKQID